MRIMFDKSRFGEILPELLIRRANNLSLGIENKCAGTGRALING